MKRILIANRGEIACRVARTAHSLGYETVAVFSDADRGARHTMVADVAVHIGGSEAAASYLDVARLLDAAKKTGADAVHPGYGFLAENAGFAEACAEAGLVFVGPPPDAIRAMGSKRQAKLRMEAAGVPVVPGYSGDAQDVEVLLAEGEKLGYPLMIKASAGGGGRGLRLVTNKDELTRALSVARAEAESAFGDGELILERAVVSPRHVEIQVFADQHGNVVHLGERDCSVQRRHQKVVEEAPSPAVDAALREKMGAAAVEAARAIGYVGAGTVEMLLGADGEFYFMEMNTRLQVEHPVTEMVTGRDLVEWQLDVAAGRPLPMSQDELSMNGHSIEVRLYAEDAYAGFVPQTGTIGRIVWPEGVRVDHGLVEGQAVTAFYDAMIAKLVAYGRDRDEARRKLVRALKETRVEGLVTNQAYLIAILEHEVFATGGATTSFIGEHLDDATAPAPDELAWAVAALSVVANEGDDPWRSNAVTGAPVRLRYGEETRRLLVQRGAPDRVGELELSHLSFSDGGVAVEHDGVVHRFGLLRSSERIVLSTGGQTFEFTIAPASDKASAEQVSDAIVAPMSGKVVVVRAAANTKVTKGDVLVVLEAMKMQMELVAPRDGTVETVRVAEGDQVDGKQLLVELSKEES